MHHFNWSSAIMYKDWFAFILYNFKPRPMQPAIIGWLIVYSERQPHGGGGGYPLIKHYLIDEGQAQY